MSYQRGKFSNFRMKDIILVDNATVFQYNLINGDSGYICQYLFLLFLIIKVNNVFIKLTSDQSSVKFVEILYIIALLYRGKLLGGLDRLSQNLRAFRLWRILIFGLVFTAFTLTKLRACKARIEAFTIPFETAGLFAVAVFFR